MWQEVLCSPVVILTVDISDIAFFVHCFQVELKFIWLKFLRVDTVNGGIWKKSLGKDKNKEQTHLNLDNCVQFVIYYIVPDVAYKTFYSVGGVHIFLSVQS